MNKIFAIAALLIAATLAAEIVPPFGAPSPIYYFGNGTVTFTCTEGVPSTTVSAANATLFSDAAFTIQAGTYNLTFYNNDGSTTRVLPGGILNTTENVGSLPNTLGVAFRGNGTGLFDKIAFITRFNATGGVAPATCPTGASSVSVDYTAIYGFYRAAVPVVNVPGATLKNTFRAVGTLTVVCETGAVSAIDSILYTVPESGAPAVAGTYNGTFASNDGSFTVASAPQAQAVSGPVALTWFVATGLNTAGTGALNGITNITRYDTVGGVCTPVGATGTQTAVPFEASYGFYTFEILTTSSTASASSTATSPVPSSSRSGAVAIAFSGALLVASALLMA